MLTGKNPMNKKNAPEEMLKVLKEATAVALLSHISPDGDCLGSMLAIGLALEKMGKEVVFYNPDQAPSYLAFLPGSSRIKQELPSPKPKVLLFVDCTDLERVSSVTSDIIGDSTALNLDHHISNQFFGDYNWVDCQAAASGEIAWELINRLGVVVDSDMAANLYTAILTDTGCFAYSNTTARTHRLAAELLDIGIDMTGIHNKVYEQKPLAQVKLLGCSLNSLEILVDGQLAVMALSFPDFQKSGAELDLSEGLINHARSIEGVEVAVLLKEIGPGEIKAGLRSNLWLDVNQVAARFGGGGHLRAAGCTFKGSLAEAKQTITAALEEALEIGRNH